MIDNARCQIQIDIGFGDAVTPGPEEADYPVMLSEFEAPKLKVYPRYTVVAEKFEALTTLGIANSRMKDYFDLWTLTRRTSLTRSAPLGLTDAFAQDDQKQIQWQAFLRKNKLEALALIDVVETLSTFLQPIYEAGNDTSTVAAYWQAGGPWSTVAND